MNNYSCSKENVPFTFHQESGLIRMGKLTLDRDNSRFGCRLKNCRTLGKFNSVESTVKLKV